MTHDEASNSSAAEPVQASSRTDAVGWASFCRVSYVVHPSSMAAGGMVHAGLAMLWCHRMAFNLRRNSQRR